MEKRPLSQLENELVDSLVSKDPEGVLDVIKERPELIVFFCALSIRVQEQVVMKSVLDILPEELENLRTVIKRMTYMRPDKNAKIEIVAELEETPIAS